MQTLERRHDAPSSWWPVASPVMVRCRSRTNPIVHLSAAVAGVAAWKPPVRLNDTTPAYIKRLAGLSAPADARRYLDAIGSDPKLVDAADEYFLEHEPAARR